MREKRSFKSSLADTLKFFKAMLLILMSLGILLKAEFYPNLMTWFLLHYIVNEQEKMLRGKSDE